MSEETPRYPGLQPDTEYSTNVPGITINTTQLAPSAWRVGEDLTARVAALEAENARLRAVLDDLFIPHDSNCPCYEGSAAELAQVRCVCGADTTRAAIAAALGES